jgi:hypothetical protein
VHDLRDALDAGRFVGRAPQQVEEFVAEVVDPLLADAPAPVQREEVRV